jgi:outer membrane protein
VKDEVKSEQFDLVFDVSGHSVNNVPVVMYAAEKYDFTDKVITKLNADAPKGAAATDKPADKPADKAAEKPADKPAEKKK